MAKIMKMVAAATLMVWATAFAGEVWVGGQEMYASKDIVDNAVNSADHTTLVANVMQSNGVIHVIDRVVLPN